ncbi:PKD domain-containing protein [Mucilaginibacter gilvus]|uniref:PKD domain-containing protein n=1 Tax=Mucilaginibacter gilvus TaxID=2305909 RepID=A0A444MRF6_9SPHI|nr:PKD domain-containing protein [Mucilaginibacter gilvus]RWY54198.1 PKD domain-containing protein [Mucilaginibacter gilvus]
MERIFTRSLLFVFTFSCFVITGVRAQTVIIGNIDPGPYGQSSTIAVPFHLNTTTACSSSTNVFNLYLSDANGNFGAPTLIGSYAGFYGTFVNGIIPNGTATSPNYRIRIQCTDPAILPVTSGPFTISASAGITAGTSSQAVNTANPEIFGSCIGSDNTSYAFVNASSAGAAASATFFNELSQTDEGSITFPAAPFIAKAANYTVIVRATNAGIVGTKAFSLINNLVNNSFGASGSNQVCLDGQTKLTYSVDINSPNGIQKNYPGLIYSVTWGDGLSTNYTLCEIVATGGFIDHTYKKASCGNVANGLQNVFQIDLQPTSPFCGKLGTPVTGYARVIEAPKNKIGYSETACTNTVVTFGNISIPGQDPNSTSFDCTNAAALYTWVVDGIVVAVNYPLEKLLEYTFTTNGKHHVGLHLQNGNAICDVEDKIIEICIQDAPKPSFTLANSTICTSGPVTPVNTSIVDENCDVNTTYTWRVTGPAQPTFLGGTTAASKTPKFNFTVAGLYTLTLDITTISCGLVSSEPQEVVINLNPVAKLSADGLVCGKDQVLTFGPNATTTKTTLTGTAKTLPATYVWTITGGAFSYENGTTANSQYPQVKFTDYNTYTITVTHTNNCNVASDSQVLTFQEAPLVNAGGDQAVCEGNIVSLAAANITGVYNSFKWVGGTGTFSPSRNAMNPTYTPSAAEITAGTSTIILEVTTNLAAPCNIISTPAVITITRKDNITSANTADVCTGSNFTYTITSANPVSNFSWTASVTSGSATGFSATGSGNTINDVINDTGVGDATIVYIITPTTNGCPGVPFPLTLTVNRIPVLTATPAAVPICSGQPTGVVLTSTQANTTYTWTSVADADIHFNSEQTTPVAVTTIPDLLTNTGTLYGIVKYTITPYHGACAGAPVTVTVVIAPPPIAALAGPDESICNGLTYTLQGNDPSPGTGQWTLISGQVGVTFANSASATSVVNGLKPGNVYQFVWSINTSPGCTPNTDEVTITVDAPTIGGIIAGSASVCADANHDFLVLSGNVGKVLSWESSTDGVNWVTLLDITNQYEYTDLTQTTQFRAVVQNGTCAIEHSAIATITVNQPVIPASGGIPLTTLCNASVFTLSGNDPTPFAGIWTQTGGPPVIFADATDPKTQITGLIGGNTYKFTWTIKGSAPCPDSQNEITIVNNPDVTPKFINDYNTTVCGPVTVNFTNQSSNFAGTTYLWDFGDGTGNTNAVNPQHTFQPGTDGEDVVYTVSLTIINNCVAREPFKMDILVRPSAPTAVVQPEKLSACGSLAIRLKNTSPGNNQYYDFFVFDGNTQVLPTIRKTDKSDAVFASLGPPRNDAFYTVYMVATDLCDNTTKSVPTPINIYPATFVPLFFSKDNKSEACYPFTATFVNISSGGTKFFYRIYSPAGVMIDEIQGSKTEQPYTFVAPGTYFVSIVAQNDCATFESTERIKFEAYPQPLPDFTADITSGCKAIRVKFSNTTVANGATPPQSLSYEWDFGDGTAHFFGYTPLPHLYLAKNSPFTVTLKVNNLSTGCTNIIVKTNFIKVNPAPNVDFDASPGFITKIPNYHFAFDDKTSGNPVSWAWDFGDNSTSTQQNPGHTYADTGTYKVTLRVINRDGCDSTVVHKVQITGVPGQLYIPNAFMPAGSTSELRTFVMKGSGIETWRMQIFNNWGQLVWETTKLNSTGEPVESWDGTYKGVPVQQGVYVWQASAKFINGTEWKGMQYGPATLPKRTGVIHLIR